MNRARSALLFLASAIAIPLPAQPVCKNATSPGNCPAVGCAQPDTPEAEANVVRRRYPSKNEPLVRMTIQDFEERQIAANELGLQGFAIGVGERYKYKKLGEGNRVEVLGFIVGTPHARRADTANCRLVGRDNNTFRIHIAELPDDTEFDSILAEMIPQSRLTGWTLPKLRRIADLKKRVRVVGQLFYDSKRVVNNDPDDEQSGHPKRLSLWEIHPVSELWVCTGCQTHECDPADPSAWRRLEMIPDPDIRDIGPNEMIEECQ